MKVWVISQYFKPEYGAVQSRLHGFIKFWQKDGSKVTVFTTTPHHDPRQKMNDYNKTPSVFKEKYDSIDVWRHTTNQIKTHKFASRFKSQLSFAFKLYMHRFKEEHKKNKPDVIIATSPSLPCCLVGYFLAKYFNAKFIFEVRNLLPETHIASRTIAYNSVYAKILNYFSNYLYQKADSIVTLSVSMAKALAFKGVDKNKIFLVYDGISDDLLEKADRNQHSLKATSIKNNLQIHPLTKIVMFLGVHSAKQGLGQILEAARMLLNRNDIIFLMVGDGEDKPRLQNMAKGMPNVQFLPTVNESEVFGYYAAADILLIPHRDSTNINLHIPIKLFEILATKTPAIAALSGEAKSLVEESKSAFVVNPEEPQGLVQCIINTLENYESAKLRAQEGPEFVAKRFRQSSLARQYSAIIKKTISS